MAVSRVLLLACLVAASEARLVTLPTPPAQWVRVAPANGTAVLTGSVALVHGSAEELYARVLAISDPASPSYGKHMTTAQVGDVTAPADGSVAAVVAWLQEHGLRTEYQRNIGAVAFRGTVAEVSAAFGASFQLYRDSGAARKALRERALTLAYTIPAAVEAHVATVYGLHGLPLPRSGRRGSAGSVGEATVTPAALATQYGIKATATGSVKNRQAVAEFQGQASSDSDLVKFFQQLVPNAPAGADKLYAVVGSDTGATGVEANLDVQYIMGVAPGVKTEFWGFLGNAFCDDLKQFTAKILSQDDNPNVFSISYGWQGDLNKLQCTADQAADVDFALAKIAAKGISVILASGDSGSGYDPTPPQPESCQAVQRNTCFEGTNATTLKGAGYAECCRAANAAGFHAYTYKKGFFNEHSCVGYSTVTSKSTDSKCISAPIPHPEPATAHMWPSWPASSPWVTAVGATSANQIPGTEAATTQFGSGGGFSYRFARSPNATWQQTVVSSYLQNYGAKLPPSSTYEASGRATPDVSALGEAFQVVVSGRTEGVGGTSASAPTFAAIVSLLNDARIAGGKSALGFLNPFIYSNADAFTDVTTGSNAIDRSGAPAAYGWECKQGWDAVTGFGTPKFASLLAAAMKA